MVYSIIVKKRNEWITISEQPKARYDYKKALSVANDYATREQKAVRVLKDKEIIWESVYK
jgi:hypothetical protein